MMTDELPKSDLDALIDGIKKQSEKQA
jgi:hypothetical protein